MEEGSISVDPDSENPAADFYANSEAADIGDDQEVEDAGPGNHLDGWIHPELLDPPSPEDVASFVDPATQNAAPVLNPVDYQRNPGAALAMGSARRNIKKIRSELTKTHEEAQAAKAKLEAELHEVEVGFRKDWGTVVEALDQEIMGMNAGTTETAGDQAPPQPVRVLVTQRVCNAAVTHTRVAAE